VVEAEHVPLAHILDLTCDAVVILGMNRVVHPALVDIARAVGRQRAIAGAADDAAALQGRFVARVRHHVIELAAGHFQRHG